MTLGWEDIASVVKMMTIYMFARARTKDGTSITGIDILGMIIMLL